MANDITVTKLLDDIARKLESLAGIDPGLLASDTEVSARLARIRDAIRGGALEAHPIPDHTDVDIPVLPDDGDFLRFRASDSKYIAESIDTLDVSETVDDKLSRGWDGSIIESAAITVASDGTVITLSVEASGGGDLTTRFGGKSYTFDSTPAATIALTAGTDTAPIENWIFLTEASGVVSISTNTTGWPTTPFNPLATVLCQSAATLQTDGALKVHAWTDHINTSTENGHISHLSRKVRQANANWDAGTAAGNLVISNPDAYISVAAGTVFQLHNHVFPARDMQTGDQIYVVNDPTTPYKRITTLDDITQDASGGSINNRHFNLVLWGSVNEAEADCKLFVNLPTNTYASSSAAETDAQSFSTHTIPTDFRGTGFLIARYNVQGKSSGAWTQNSKTDLRGLVPSLSAGGVTGPLILDDLSDTTVPSPSNNDVLRWSNSSSAWVNTAGVFFLDDLLDVALSVGDPDKQIMTGIWSGPAYDWQNEDFIINAINDVVITSASSGDFLRYDGSDWVDEVIQLGDIPAGVLLADGTVPLTADWDAGAFEITANKFIAQDTSEGSFDTADFGLDFTTTANDLGTTYRGVYIDHDYVLDTGDLGAGTIRGAQVDLNTSGAGTYVVRNFAAYGANIGVDGKSLPISTISTPAGMNLSLSGSAASTVYGAYTEAVNDNAAGAAYGYQGFGKNTAASGGTVQAIGVFGFAQTTSGLAIGLQGSTVALGTSKFGLSVRSHAHFYDSVAYFYDSTAIQAAVTTTHITPGTDNGSVWIEKLLEVDGTAYFDGPLSHLGATLGFFSATPAAQAGAYTQTYATASATHANPTAVALTDSTGGTANQTLVAISGSGDDAAINDNFADLADEVNKLIADVANVKQVANQMIDDLQAYGLFQ